MPALEHRFVSVTDPAWPACVCGRRPGAAGSPRSDRALALFVHVAAARELARRTGIAWHEGVDTARWVPDLTCGAWPAACGARAEFRRPGAAVTFRAVCTRRASHTGRHAAGHGGRVVAVWSGPRT